MGYLPYQLVSRIFSPSTVWIPKIAIVSRTYLFQTIILGIYMLDFQTFTHRHVWSSFSKGWICVNIRDDKTVRMSYKSGLFHPSYPRIMPLIARGAPINIPMVFWLFFFGPNVQGLSCPMKLCDLRSQGLHECDNVFLRNLRTWGKKKNTHTSCHWALLCIGHF